MTQTAPHSSKPTFLGVPSADDSRPADRRHPAPVALDPAEDFVQSLGASLPPVSTRAPGNPPGSTPVKAVDKGGTAAKPRRPAARRSAAPTTQVSLPRYMLLSELTQDFPDLLDLDLEAALDQVLREGQIALARIAQTTTLKHGEVKEAVFERKNATKLALALGSGWIGDIALLDEATFVLLCKRSQVAED